MSKQITQVTVFFEAIAKGKRKAATHSFKVATLEGHIKLSPEQKNDYERQFWKYYDEAGFRAVGFIKGKINVNFGNIDGDIISIQMLPVQSTLLQGRS